MEVTDIVKSKGWDPADPAIRFRISIVRTSMDTPFLWMTPINRSSSTDQVDRIHHTWSDYTVTCKCPDCQFSCFFFLAIVIIMYRKNPPYPPSLTMGKPFLAEFIDLENGTKTETNLVNQKEQHFNIKGIQIDCGIIDC